MGACSESSAAAAATPLGDAAADARAVPADQEACSHARSGPTLLDQRYSMPTFALGDERVLLVGGHFNDRTMQPLDTCEVVDVENDSSTFTGTFNVPRTNSGPGGTSRLLDGRVFSASPFVWSDEEPIPSEIWDPETEMWTVTGAQSGVGGGPAVTLPDGRILVAGGIDWNVDEPMAAAQIWDPATGSWERTGNMASPRTGHALVIVDDRAMAIGGFDAYPGGDALATTEIFDADSGTWAAAAPLNYPRGVMRTAPLPEGRLLSAGGNLTSGGNQPVSADAEIYDPSRDRWIPVDPMSVARAAHSLVALPDGRVLAIGGAVASWSDDTASVEVFTPSLQTWSDASPLGTARRLHSAVLLPSGDVAVLGGSGRAAFTSEIYTPCAG